VRRWLLALVVATLLPAVPASAASLAGTHWKVTRIAGEPVGEFGLKLDFAAREIHGNDGCNTYGARYRVNGSRIRFRRFISTAIGCEGDTIPSITQRLMRARRYVLAGERLKLLRGGRTLVVLKRR
jgi:heat shock protein HslJ